MKYYFQNLQDVNRLTVISNAESESRESKVFQGVRLGVEKYVDRVRSRIDARLEVSIFPKKLCKYLNLKRVLNPNFRTI